MIQCNEILTLAIVIVVAAGVASLIGWQAIIGFAIGVTTIFAAAVVAGGDDFE